MNNFYRLLLLSSLLALFCTGHAQAQANFRPGYVLPLSGDTLRGEVDYREGRLNAQRCQFRANARATVTTYTPAELRGYGLPASGKQYRALSVKPTPTTPAQPYFLEILADGSASLYFLRDAQQHDSYYVASSRLSLTQLEHSTVQVMREGRTYNEEQTPYRNTLVVALASCPQVQVMLPRLPFQESALLKVVNLFNACQGSQVAPLSKVAASESQVVWGVMAGVAQHSMSYTGYPYDVATIVSRHTGYAVGPTLRVSSSRLSQKLSLVAALLYEPEKYEIVADNRYAGGVTGTSSRLRFDLAYLRLPVMMRYSLPQGKVKPLVEAGFTLAYGLKKDNTIEQSDVNGQFQNPQPLFLNDTFRTLQLGLGVGVGLSTRTASGRLISLLARAEKSNGFSNAEGVSNTVTHFYGLLSVDLTK